MSNPTSSVFEGIRVLDIGHIVAGPIAASVFADFGADVIKIEHPETGDPLRRQYANAEGIGMHWKVEGRNKRPITLDLKTPEGREIFHRLVKLSDVVIENFRPGVLERLGCGWDTLSAINPRLVLCRLSGFGQTGPYRDRRAYGRIGEAFAGFAHITGNPDGPPMHSQMSIGDTVAGMWAAMGVMMALYWRDAQGGGVGQVIDIGLYEGLFRQIEQQIISVDQLGRAMKRSGNTHYTPYVYAYRTRDGGYFSVAAATQESAMDVLRALGLDNDPRFNEWNEAIRNVEAYREISTQWFAERTLAEVEAAFQKYDAPGSSVMSGDKLIDHPHILAREMVITVEDKELGPVRMQGIVPKLSRTPGHVECAGQPMGAANDAVYGDLLQMSADEIAALKGKRVI